MIQYYTIIRGYFGIVWRVFKTQWGEERAQIYNGTIWEDSYTRTEYIRAYFFKITEEELVAYWKESDNLNILKL